MSLKIIRSSNTSFSINNLCEGLLRELQEDEGYEVVAVAPPGNEMKIIEEREGVRTVAVPMERRIAPFSDLKSLFELIWVFSKEKPTMVHSMTPKAGLLSMMAARFCRVPVRVHTFTGLVFPTSTGLMRKILAFTDKITCKCATHIIPEGEGVKNDLINHNITQKPLKVLGYGNIRGIDLKLYDPEDMEIKAEAAKIRKKGVFTFVYIGRLLRDKGINELVNAFTTLNKEFPKTQLILIGQEEKNIAPLKKSTIELIEKSQAIEAVGRQNDVRPWLAASDTLVFPSYREGFPNVVIEAGAMGLPSIVTDINGSKEIIIEGKNGTIIPPRDSEALYKAMRRFLQNPEMIRQMGMNARPLIASRYEQSYVHQCLKDYYKEILTNGSVKNAEVIEN